MSNNRWSFVDETIPDGTKLPVGSLFTKVWVLKNAGDTTWTTDYRLQFAKNRLMSAQDSIPLMQNVAPGDTLTLTVPMTVPHKEGNYFSHYQLLDENGTPLKSATTSQITYLWLEIDAVPEEEVTEKPKSDISFWIWEGETIEDNTQLAGGTHFKKMWIFTNAGPSTWTTDYTVRYIGEDLSQRLAPDDAYPLPHIVEPNKRVVIEVPMTVPEKRGTYKSDWALFDGDDNIVYMKSKRKHYVFYAQIRAIPKEDIKGSTWILLDETIPDGTGITVDTEFIKTWTFRNAGPAAWTPDYTLKRIDGNSYTLGKDSAYRIPDTVLPGDEIQLSIPMVAPSAPGQYREKWQILDDDGAPVVSKKWRGAKSFWVEIAALSDHIADGFWWPGGDISNPDKKWGGWRDAQPFKRDYRGQAEKEKRSPFYHPGADLNGPGWGDADLGLPIHAIGHGVVIFAADVNVWGNLILIEHVMPDGRQFWSQYAHMQDVYVEMGQKVYRGDEIGTVGKGDDERYWAHLHFEMRKRYISAAAWSRVVYNQIELDKYYVDPLATIRKFFHVEESTD